MTPRPFTYRDTHVSKGDGSPAMLVSEDPFVLINEDGYTWLADPGDWEAIAVPVRSTWAIPDDDEVDAWSPPSEVTESWDTGRGE
jgi:hypothetical protein